MEQLEYVPLYVEAFIACGILTLPLACVGTYTFG